MSEASYLGTIPENVVNAINKLVKEIMEEESFWSRGKGSRLWRFNPEKGIYEQDGEIFLRRMIAERAIEDRRYKSHILNETVSAILDLSAVGHYFDLGGEPNIIVCKSRLGDPEAEPQPIALNLETGEIMDPSPELFKTIRIDVEYDESATCDRFSQFLNEVLEDETAVQAMWEFIGYCLFQDSPYDIFVVLVGDGANGKSVLIEVLTRFLGTENVSSVTLQQLATNKFAPAQLYGKLANLAGEIPRQAIGDASKLKDLTGGNEIIAEFKHMNQFNFKNTAKLLFSANEPPAFYDKTTGLWRRLRKFNFPHTFGINGEPAIPRDRLVSEMTTPQEMSGILNKAIEGLQRLRATGEFTGTKTAEETRIDYQRQSNPLEYLAEHYFSLDMDAEPILKRSVYELYLRWCHHDKKRPRGERSFQNSLRMVSSVTETQIKMEDGSRPKAWKNLRIDLEALEQEGLDLTGIRFPDSYRPAPEPTPEPELQDTPVFRTPELGEFTKKELKFLIDHKSGSSFEPSTLEKENLDSPFYSLLTAGVILEEKVGGPYKIRKDIKEALRK